MGSLFGGCLKEGGADVTLIDANDRQVEAIRTQGLRLVTDKGSGEGDRVVSIPAVTPAEAEGTFDLILVFTKTMHTRAALSGVSRVIGPQTFLFSLQNGLDNKETLIEFASPDRVIVGVTTYPADLVAPGHVQSHGSGIARFKIAADEPEAAGHHEILDALQSAFAAAGLNLVHDPATESAIWEKVAFNAALNSLCAITRSTVGEIGADPETRGLAVMIVDEVCRTAAAAGVKVDRDHVQAVVAHAMEHHTHHKPSMLQDILAGRTTEIETINGAVVRRAAALDVGTPVTSTLLRLVRHVQSSHTRWT
ncbi:2-dehydropantoate 2-reductase (EC 1.1.1.169) [Azospirillum endophyticum]